jgi:hypothetical protein
MKALNGDFQNPDALQRVCLLIPKMFFHLILKIIGNICEIWGKTAISAL